MFIPDPEPEFLPIPDPGVKKAPDPGSATLVSNFLYGILFICSVLDTGTHWFAFTVPGAIFAL